MQVVNDVEKQPPDHEGRDQHRSNHCYQGCVFDCHSRSMNAAIVVRNRVSASLPSDNCPRG